MKQVHQFRMKMPETFQRVSLATQYIVALMRIDLLKVEQWIDESQTCNFFSTPLVEHTGEDGLWGVTTPAYFFYHDADAVAFKLVFGDKFEYSAYESDDY